MKETLYWYDLKNLNTSDKVKFVYMLKGRKKETGLVETLEGRWLVPGCFLIPSENAKVLEETMKQWKVKYNKKLLVSK